jgi:hypothetical protein
MLGYVVVYSMFRRDLLPLLSGKSALRHSSNMKMEAAGSSRTSVTFYQTTRCETPEDSNIHIHCRENHIIMLNDSWYERNYPLRICFYKSRQRISLESFETFTVAFSSKIVGQIWFRTMTKRLSTYRFRLSYFLPVLPGWRLHVNETKILPGVVSFQQFQEACDNHTDMTLRLASGLAPESQCLHTVNVGVIWNSPHRLKSQ